MRNLLLLSLAMLGAVAGASTGLDVRVDGEGYLRFARGSHVVYTTRARLVVADGRVATPEGLPIVPAIPAPPGATLRVDLEGNVFAAGKPAGRIVLALFPSAAALRREGDYAASVQKPKLANPGEGLAGVIRTGAAPTPAPARPAASAVTAPAGVTLTARTEIDAASILLGAIARIEADSALAARIGAIDLGRAPLAGSERGVSAAYVRARLLNAGLKSSEFQLQGAPVAVVARKSQTISVDALLRAARDAVRAQLSIEATLAAEPVREIVVPTGAVEVVAGGAVRGASGIAVPLTIQVDGAPVARRTVTLATPAASQVKAYETVTLRLVRNGATVEMPAKVRTPGAQGERVTVAVESGATFTGVLLEGGVVEVRL